MTRILSVFNLLKRVGFAILLFGGTVYAQPPDSLWSRIFGRSSYDQFGAFEVTADSGLLIVGGTRSVPDSSLSPLSGWIIKTDAEGDTIWTRTYEGAEGVFFSRVQDLGDTCYLLGGSFLEFEQDSGTALLYKVDSLGDITWANSYHIGRDVSYCGGLEKTPDGGYLLAGFCLSFVEGGGDLDSAHAWLLRTNVDGDSLWMRTYTTGPITVCYDMRPALDGGYILVGVATLPGSRSLDSWLARVDANGDTLWTRQITGSDGNDEFLGVTATLDSGFVVVGTVTRYDGSHLQLWLVKFDASGNLQWEREYGGPATDKGYSVVQTDDGGFLIGGEYGWPNSDFWILKTDSIGMLEWDLMPAPDGNSTDGGEVCYQVEQLTSDELIAAGMTWFGGSDIAVMKFGMQTDNGREPPAIPDSLAMMPSVYPNPFNANATIQWYQTRSGPVLVKVYDLLGRLVMTLADEPFEPGKHILQLNGNSLSSGSYFLQVQTPDYLHHRRLLLLK